MGPFFETQAPRESFSYQHYMEKWGLSKADAKRTVQRLKSTTFFRNEKYQVAVQPCETGPGFPTMVHLEVHTLDRAPIRDWREMQVIKNSLVGSENEGVELYPAESRLVDGANSYHLWVFADPKLRFPFGYTVREVGDESINGAVQRPRNEEPENTDANPEGQQSPEPDA